MDGLANKNSRTPRIGSRTMDARPKSVRLPVRGGSQEAPIPADNFNALWDFGALADGGGIPSWGCERPQLTPAVQRQL